MANSFASTSGIANGTANAPLHPEQNAWSLAMICTVYKVCRVEIFPNEWSTILEFDLWVQNLDHTKSCVRVTYFAERWIILQFLIHKSRCWWSHHCYVEVGMPCQYSMCHKCCVNVIVVGCNWSLLVSPFVGLDQIQRIWHHWRRLYLLWLIMAWMRII